jgi:hypothetical protein
MLSLGANSSDPPGSVAACVVNSEPRTFTRSLVRLCVGLKIQNFDLKAKEMEILRWHTGPIEI